MQRRGDGARGDSGEAAAIIVPRHPDGSDQRHRSRAGPRSGSAALDYLLKPFDQERFRKTLARVRPRHLTSGTDERQALLSGLLAQLERSARAQPEERPRLLAEFNGRLHVIDVTQVEMIEADRNYVLIRVGRDSYHARSTLSQAEHALRSQPMLRISRSCLVNINFVREVNRTLRGDFILVLAGGATVTSSEGFRGKVKEYLGTLRIPS